MIRVEAEQTRSLSAEGPRRRLSLDEVVVRTRPMIEGYVAARVRNQQDRDEVVSRIFAALARSWPSFRGECSASGYVLKIAAHALTNYYERDLPRERRQISLETWIEDPEVQHLRGHSGPHEDVHRRSEVVGILREMRRACSAEQCAVVELIYQGRSMDEIASLLNIKPATVRSHFLRGRERLLAHLLLEAPDYLGGMAGVEAAARQLERIGGQGLTAEERNAVRKRGGSVEVIRRAMLKLAPFLTSVLWLSVGVAG